MLHVAFIDDIIKSLLCLTVVQGDQKVCAPDGCTVIVRCTETF
jgi:hypothetical protein